MTTTNPEQLAEKVLKKAQELQEALDAAAEEGLEIDLRTGIQPGGRVPSIAVQSIKRTEDEEIVPEPKRFRVVFRVKEDGQEGTQRTQTVRARTAPEAESEVTSQHAASDRKVTIESTTVLTA